MNRKEKLVKVFVEVFNISENEVNEDLSKENLESWDSVAQLSLATALEDTFNIMLDAEDILDCTSYLKVNDVLDKCKVDL